MSQSLLSAMQGRSVFRIGLLASTIAAFLPTHVNSYASSPSTTSGESICFSSSKLTARLYAFFSCVLCSSSSISVMQFGNRAAMRSMFCAVISGDSMRSLSIGFILLHCKFAKVANRIFQKFFLCYEWKLVEALLCLFISIHEQVRSTSCCWWVIAFCEFG